ncbi:hypothetical protein KCU76_g14743, partial [Aureobasidium melanogenum]
MCKGAVCDNCSRISPPLNASRISASLALMTHIPASLLTTSIGKRTWFGCGMHVPSVMDSIPKSEWCDCEPKTEKNGTEYPPMGKLDRTFGIA